MKPILSIEGWRIPRCSCCKSYDGLGRADTDDDTGAWWWWCRSCDPRLAPPHVIPGQGVLDYDGARPPQRMSAVMASAAPLAHPDIGSCRCWP